MKTAELDHLELEINQLIDSVNKLRSENHALRQKIAISARERSRLQEINHNAALKIKRVINQLKEELL